MLFFSSVVAETFNGTNASSTCVCSLKVIGLASDNTIIEQAAVECLGQDCASVVQLAVTPPLVPFMKSFRGTNYLHCLYSRRPKAFQASHCAISSSDHFESCVHCTHGFLTGVTVTTLSNTNNSASNLTALMTLSGDSLVVKDSQFLRLATSYDAILLLESSRVSMVNTSFVANQGSVTGGVAVVGVGNMSFKSCNFLSNQGTLVVPAVAIAVAAIAPFVIMQQSLHSVDVPN